MGLQQLYLLKRNKKNDDGGLYKTNSGLSLEVNFSPFSANPIQINYLKAKMFLSDNMAIRLGFELNSYSETTNTVFNPGTTQVIEEAKNSYFIFGLHPGIEFHLEGTDRLSPYYGAEINFAMKSASTDITNVNGVDKTTLSCTGNWVDGSNQAYTMFGLNLILGADYFIAKHLYIGAEVGFGFRSFSYKDVTIMSSSGSLSNTFTTPGGSGMDLGVNFNSLFRLGWAFN